MATNYVHDGTVVDYANSGAAISSGDVVVIENMLGVALVDIAATTGTGAVQIEGVFDLPKVDAAVITLGQMVIWDVSAGAFDDDQATPATGDVSNAAIAMESLGATTGANIKVKLNRAPGTIT